MTPFEILVLCCFVSHPLLFSKGQTMAKSFQVTRANSGAGLCANDPPSTALNVSGLNGLLVDIGAAPSMILCGWACTMDASCTSYNWRDDIQVCELYNYDPTNCSIVSCCSLYQVQTKFFCIVRFQFSEQLLECWLECLVHSDPSWGQFSYSCNIAFRTEL